MDQASIKTFFRRGAYRFLKSNAYKLDKSQGFRQDSVSHVIYLSTFTVPVASFVKIPAAKSVVGERKLDKT